MITLPNIKTILNSIRDSIATAQSSADKAQRTADAAKSRSIKALVGAINTQSTLDDARNAADYAQRTAISAKSNADKALSQSTPLGNYSVKSIPDFAFVRNKSIKTLDLPMITSIGTGAFHDCTNLSIDSIPDGVKTIGRNAFLYCEKITISKFPEELTTIGESAFKHCTGLTDIVFGSKLSSIGGDAFAECSGLRSVTFNSTPELLTDGYDTPVFQSCTNLTTINVPWSEGAVANAPWGATNATINYDYVAPTA